MANSSGSISKTEFKELVRTLSGAIGGLPNTMKFIQDQFARAMEKSVEAGKAEIECFVRNTLVRASMEHLSEKRLIELASDEQKKLDKP